MPSTTSPGPGVGSGKSSSASSQSPRNTTPFMPGTGDQNQRSKHRNAEGREPIAIAPIATPAIVSVHRPGVVSYTAGGILGEGRQSREGIVLGEAVSDRGVWMRRHGA